MHHPWENWEIVTQIIFCVLWFRSDTSDSWTNRTEVMQSVSALLCPILDTVSRRPACFWLGWGSLGLVHSILLLLKSPSHVSPLPFSPGAKFLPLPAAWSSFSAGPAFFPRAGRVEAVAYLQWSSSFSFHSCHIYLWSLGWIFIPHGFLGSCFSGRIEFIPCGEPCSPWVISVEQCLLLFSTCLSFFIFPVRHWSSSS